MSETIPIDQECRIDEKQVAEILSMSVSFVQKLRARSDGIPYEKYGSRCKYRASDVFQWRDNRRVQSNADALSRGITKPIKRKNEAELRANDTPDGPFGSQTVAAIRSE